MSQTCERPRPPLASLLTQAGPLFKVKLVFLLASFVSFVLSVSLWFTDHQMQGIFVGIWVPSILSLGALLLASNRGDVR
jgi:hypothetical protein